MKMSKSLKIILISAATAVIAIATVVCVYFAYAGQLRFVAKDSKDAQSGYVLLVSSMSAPEGMPSSEIEGYFKQLEQDGYYTNAPIFTNNTDYGTKKYIKVYQSMLDGYSPYLREMAKKYENHVKIDYSVDINDKDKTVTVSFTGTGLTKEGKTEAFGRDYVFDTSNADENHMPVLMA